MREGLSSRLGFLMVAAGCAVGLGNVWRFPFVVGQNGGAAFVAVYLVFLVLFGFPVLLAELSVGRGSGTGIAGAFRKLGGTLWGRVGMFVFAGNLLLMIYYTDVVGWLLIFAKAYAVDGSPPGFGEMTGDSGVCLAAMLSAVAVATAVCAAGLRRGVERITKWMMISLIALICVLAARTLALDGAMKGVEFYLKPDWRPLLERPAHVVFEAMGQAFFTLSIGIGAMAIFGSYTRKRDSLVKESALIILIDTFVAVVSGLVVFSACAAYGVDVTAGMGLIFEVLPKVFGEMPGGRFWGFAFFVFLSLAAVTTVIAVFECLIGGIVDMTGRPRAAVAPAVGAAVALLSLPCVFSDAVLEVEDMVVSKLWLPAGGMAFALFVSCDFGWGWRGFREEASAGRGPDLPDWTRPVFRYAVPVLILLVLLGGLT